MSEYSGVLELELSIIDSSLKNVKSIIDNSLSVVSMSVDTKQASKQLSNTASSFAKKLETDVSNTKFKGLKSTLQSAVDSISTSSFGEKLKNVFSKASKATNTATTAITDNRGIQNLTSSMKSLAAPLAGMAVAFRVIEPIMTALSDTISLAISPLTEYIATYIPSFMNTLQPVIDGIMPILSGLVATLMPIVSKVLTALVPPLLTLVSAVMPLLNGVLATLMPILDGLAPLLTSIFEKAMPYLLQAIEGVMTGIQWVVNSIIGLINALPFLDTKIKEIEFTSQAGLAELDLDAAKKKALEEEAKRVDNLIKKGLNKLSEQEYAIVSEHYDKINKRKELQLQNEIKAEKKAWLQKTQFTIAELENIEKEHKKALQAQAISQAKADYNQTTNAGKHAQKMLDFERSQANARVEMWSSMLLKVRVKYHDTLISMQEELRQLKWDIKMQIQVSGYDELLEFDKTLQEVLAQDKDRTFRVQLEADLIPLNAQNAEAIFAPYKAELISYVKRIELNEELSVEEFNRYNVLIEKVETMQEHHVIFTSEVERINNAEAKLLESRKASILDIKQIQRAKIETEAWYQWYSQIQGLAEQVGANIVKNIYQEQVELQRITEKTLKTFELQKQKVLDIYNADGALSEAEQHHIFAMEQEFAKQNEAIQYHLTTNLQKRLREVTKTYRDSIYEIQTATFTLSIDSLEVTDLFNVSAIDKWRGALIKGAEDFREWVVNLKEQAKQAEIAIQQSLGSEEYEKRYGDFATNLQKRNAQIDDIAKKQAVKIGIAASQSLSNIFNSALDVIQNSLTTYYEKMRELNRNFGFTLRESDISINDIQKDLALRLVSYEEYNSKLLEMNRSRAQAERQIEHDKETANREMRNTMAKSFLDTTLEVMEKALTAKMYESIFGATADSIAKEGLVGVIQAAVLAGIIKSAFGVAKIGLHSVLKLKKGQILIERGTRTAGVDDVPALIGYHESVMTRKASEKHSDALHDMENDTFTQKYVLKDTIKDITNEKYIIKYIIKDTTNSKYFTNSTATDTFNEKYNYIIKDMTNSINNTNNIVKELVKDTNSFSKNSINDISKYVINTNNTSNNNTIDKYIIKDIANRDTSYVDVNGNSVYVLGNKLDKINNRLESIERTDLKRNIHIDASVEGDPEGIVRAIKFKNRKRRML